MKKHIRAVLFALVLFSGGLMVISRSLKAAVSRSVTREELAAALPGRFSESRIQEIVASIFAFQNARRLTEQSLRALLKKLELTVPQIDKVVQQIFGQQTEHPRFED